MTAQALPLVVIGGGPAGLMAAEAARACGVEVEVHDAMGSVGRKFLVAGKGGLNLTHAEPREAFLARYGARADAVARWLEALDAEALRAWAGGLGIETFVGTSGRVFPLDLKAAPLLRRWLTRLRADGVRFHVLSRWLGFAADGRLRFSGVSGEQRIRAGAVVLALGGASWPVLGSDGTWTAELERLGIEIAPLAPSNCGFDVAWSAHLRTRFAGAAVKPVALTWRDVHGTTIRRQGEFVVSTDGIEGSLVYACSAALRHAIAACGEATVLIDLAPTRAEATLRDALAAPRNGRSLAEHLRRRAGIDGVNAALLRELAPTEALTDPHRLAGLLKALPLTLRSPRPLAEAISTAGGVRLEALDDTLMAKTLPGVFCAGEMLDWEAPTGGYLLTATMASGRIAGAAAARWLLDRGSIG